MSTLQIHQMFSPYTNMWVLNEPWAEKVVIQWTVVQWVRAQNLELNDFRKSSMTSVMQNWCIPVSFISLWRKLVSLLHLPDGVIKVVPQRSSDIWSWRRASSSGNTELSIFIWWQSAKLETYLFYCICCSISPSVAVSRYLSLFLTLFLTSP